MAGRRSTSPSMPPTTSAARRPAGSSRRPRSACSPPCWSSSPPAPRSARKRSPPGAGGSRSSPRSLLLGISVWMRIKLSESPAFAKLREEGEVSKAPLREAFARRDSLKQRADRLLRASCARRARSGISPSSTCRCSSKSRSALPAATKDMLLIVMTLVSAPLYVFFGWLSDRVGRKPVMLGGMLLALALYFPGSHLIAAAANPALVAAQRATPGGRRDRPRDLLGRSSTRPARARFDSACDIAKSLLVARGISYRDARLGRRLDRGRRRQRAAAGRRRRARSTTPASRRSRPRPATSSSSSSRPAGYPAAADPARDRSCRC